MQAILLLVQWVTVELAVAAAAAVEEVPVTTTAPIADAARAEEPVWDFWQRLPGLCAACVAAGLIASQAVYYDDDGEPTGVRAAAVYLFRASFHTKSHRLL